MLRLLFRHMSLTVFLRLLYSGNVKLPLGTMSILKLVLIVFEAVLLADCARGESPSSLSPTSTGLVLDGDAGLMEPELAPWLLASARKVSVGSWCFLAEKLEVEN